MPKSLQIVSPRLLTAQMRVDTHVARRARKGLALAVWDVLLRLRVAILLRHSEVDDVDEVRVLRPRPADEEIVWLDIPINEVLLVDSLHARYLQYISAELVGVQAREELDVKTRLGLAWVVLRAKGE